MFKKFLKVFSVFLTFTVVFSGCQAKKPSNIGIIGSSDGPTAVFVTNNDKKYDELFKHKTEYVGNNSSVVNIVNEAFDIFMLPYDTNSRSRTFEITENGGVIINFHVNNRSDYRFLDYSVFDKVTAVMFALIDNLEDVRYRMFDSFSDENDPDSAFLSLYYNINTLTSKEATAKYNKEYLKSASESKKSFSVFMNELISLNIPAESSVFEEKLYSEISENEQIVTNSLLTFTVDVTEENISEFSRFLRESADFSDCIGKKAKFITCDVYNFAEKYQDTHVFVFEGTALLKHSVFSDPKEAISGITYLQNIAEEK